MEIRHLIYFKTLAEELHFGRAAQKLFISQPPLSRQIKDLEDELNVLLFTRNNKRVALTPAGQYFLSASEKIIQQLNDAKIKAKQIQDAVSGEFKLGYISSIPKYILAHILKIVNEQYPLLRVSLYEVSTVKQKAALESGKLDLGIVRAPLLSDKLATVPLLSENFCLATPSPFINRPPELAKLPYVSYNSRYAPDYHQQFIAVCRHLGFEPQVIHECNNMSSILELVAHGLGIAIVPESAQGLQVHPGLHFFPLTDVPLGTSILLAFDEQSQHPALQFFIDNISEHYINK
ncbi:LysR family transcriptional regulator [Sphingobacterium sp. SYP-B4668]|uniref:LysR family transcriptional regulator n=1 Tax=Sphingobacterium sp. SYP-B4668 TaxID=2996035 RepID=UPI0022DE44CC|nr:LysR family transcriptional regulator [Sphingobacterium sp. SYP-B4668]